MRTAYGKRKSSSLKYASMNWVTIPQTTIRPLSRSSFRSSKTQLSYRPVTAEKENIKENKLFKASDVTFSPDEMRIITISKGIPKDQQLRRTSGQLINIRNRAEEINATRQGIKLQKQMSLKSASKNVLRRSPIYQTGGSKYASATSSVNNFKSTASPSQPVYSGREEYFNDELERNDSYISVNMQEEQETFIRDLSDERLVGGDKGEQEVNTSYFDMSPRSKARQDQMVIEDLKTHIWEYADEQEQKRRIREAESDFPIMQIDGRIENTRHGQLLDVVPNAGERKMRKTLEMVNNEFISTEMIKNYLETGKIESDEFNQEYYQKQEEHLKDGIKDTFSGYKCREYIENQSVRPPKFLEDIEFTKTATTNKRNY